MNIVTKLWHTIINLKLAIIAVVFVHDEIISYMDWYNCCICCSILWTNWSILNWYLRNTCQIPTKYCSNTEPTQIPEFSNGACNVYFLLIITHFGSFLYIFSDPIIVSSIDTHHITQLTTIGIFDRVHQSSPYIFCISFHSM